MKKTALYVILVLAISVTAVIFLAYTEKVELQPYADLIKVTVPLAGTVVQNPLDVTGEARGTWYFEAVFPVRLLDANGNEIARAQAQAESDWMTADFVPFKATLTFGVPSTSAGTLVLANDNPSGLPQNSKEVRLSVKFSH